MAQVLLALQVIVALLALQTVALALGVLYLALQLRRNAARELRRQRAFAGALAVELRELERVVRAARAESATYLEAIFSGVRGLARNLDEARATSEETLEELRHRVRSAVEAGQPPAAGKAADPPLREATGQPIDPKH